MKNKIFIPLLATLLSLLTFCPPAHAAEYNFTDRGMHDTLLAREYYVQGGKTLNVYNGSQQRIYVRIGYEGIACDYTGFILNPRQTGRVYKSPFCVPINVSGNFLSSDNTMIKPIPNPIIKTRMDDVGTLQWDVTEQDGIDYRGNWNEHEKKWDKKALYRPSLIG